MLQFIQGLVNRKELILLFIAILIVFMMVAMPTRPAPDAGLLPRTHRVTQRSPEQGDQTLDSHLFRPILVADVTPEIDLKMPLLKAGTCG